MDKRAFTEGYYDDSDEEDSDEGFDLDLLPDGDYDLNEDDEERLNILRAMTYDKSEFNK
jgi:hypothetical protein